MAKIIFSGGISAARGSIAGNVYSVNANGAYIRNRGVVANRNTPSQQAARAVLSAVSAMWRKLSNAQRESWISAKEIFPYTDKLGQTSKLTGFQLFAKLNGSLQHAGQEAINVAPTPQSLGGIEIDSITMAVGAKSLVVTQLFSITGATDVPPDTCVVVEATQPLSQGTTNPKRQDFKQVAIMGQDDDTNSPVNGFDYLSVFGKNFTTSDNIFVRVSLVSLISGERTTPTFGKATIIA